MKLFILALALLPFVAQADVVKRGKFDAYEIRTEANAPVRVVLKAEFLTEDSCNKFGFSGDFRVIPQSEGTSSAIDDYLADFNVFQTEMGCPPGKEKRKISLVSDELVLQPQNGRGVWVTILVPERYTLEIVR